MRGLGKPSGGGPCIPVEIACLDCGGKGEVDDLELRKLWKNDADTLRAFRKRRDLSLGEAARWVGVASSAWSDAEEGKVDPSTLLGMVQDRAIRGRRGGR